jgi:hypothetical protein
MRADRARDHDDGVGLILWMIAVIIAGFFMFFGLQGPWSVVRAISYVVIWLGIATLLRLIFSVLRWLGVRFSSWRRVRRALG